MEKIEYRPYRKNDPQHLNELTNSELIELREFAVDEKFKAKDKETLEFIELLITKYGNKTFCTNSYYCYSRWYSDSFFYFYDADQLVLGRIPTASYGGDDSYDDEDVYVYKFEEIRNESDGMKLVTGKDLRWQLWYLINEIENPLSDFLKIYPNPFSETIHIAGAEGGYVSATSEDKKNVKVPLLLYQNGVKLDSFCLNAPVVTIYLGHLQPGVYYFQVKRGRREAKVVKVEKIGDSQPLPENEQLVVPIFMQKILGIGVTAKENAVLKDH